MRILMIASAVPFPPLGGGQQRTFHLARALATRHDVTLLGLTFGDEHEPPPFPVRLETVAWSEPELWTAMASGEVATSEAATAALARSEEPWFASWYAVPAMEEKVATLLRERYDLVWFEGTDMTRFARLLREGVKIAVDFMDVHARMARREAERLEGRAREEALREYERTYRFERRTALRARLRLACSMVEARAAEELLEAGPVHVVPNGVDTAAFTPSAEPPVPGSILFTGTMTYPPNVQAARELALEVLPRVRAVFPLAELHLAGVDPDHSLAKLASESVRVHGKVPDLGPFFRRAAVFAAPVRSGGGTRLKVLEAAACGKAIVTTALGAEGLDLEPGAELLIAESPQEMAAAIVSLLRDPERALTIGTAARAAALRYDWEPIGRRLLDLVAREIAGA